MLINACIWTLVTTITAAEMGSSITVDGRKLVVRTPTVEAVFDGSAVTSVRPAGQNVEFIHSVPAPQGVDLLYLNDDLLGADKHQQVEVRKLSDEAARIVVTGEDSERSLLVAVDRATNDIRVTPDGISNRRGLKAVRWKVPVNEAAVVILPVVNGMQIVAEKPFPPGRRFPWPFEWNAQMAIAQRGDWSMMIHSEDRAYQFKAMQLARDGLRTELGFDTEPPGPLWENRTAGGVEWRLNVYRGDWKTPATRYRDWMVGAYDPAGKRKDRPAWVDRVNLAVCWAGPEVKMLEALAAVHPPGQTLIHLSEWRTDKYDVNYPEYTPTERTLAYMAKAREMGFHVMPHFNYWSVYYKHPFFQAVRDFQIRSPGKIEPEGWHWPPDTHDYTRMGYIHPGLGLWRSKLIEVVGTACDRTGTDVAFIDQTLCTWNTDNGLVQGMDTIEGLWKLQEEFAAVRPGLVLVGEGLNEISFQRQSFAQAHIFDGWGKLEPKHVEAAHSINAFLWAGHTRLIGYQHLQPEQEGYELGIEVYERMNALPTIITNNPKDLQEMSAATRRIFERANRGGAAAPATQGG